MKTERLSEYKIMWVIVFFDLPTETKKQRKDYSTFRKLLIADGFTMFQFSIYIRPCPSIDNAKVHIKRVETIVPEIGKVCVMCITDRQFGAIKIYEGVKIIKQKTEAIQLELF